MKVLIVKTSSLGDVIHTLPALSDAAAVIPNIEFDWVVEEDFAEIPSWHQAVKQVLPVALRRLRKEKSWAAIKEIKVLLNRLRAQKYDCIIDAQGLIKSAFFTMWAHGEKYGLDFNSVREKIAAFFYNKKIAVAKEAHAITRTRELFAKVLGYEIKGVINYGIKQSFAMPEAHDKYLVFIHGSSHPKKCWQDDKWIELARLAETKRLTVKLPWGNDLELKRAQQIAAVCNNVQVLPKSNLHDLALIFLKSSGVVAVDTGLGHLAAALDVVTVSLYQNTNPALIGTIGEQCEYIQNMADVTVGTVLGKLENATLL